MDTTAILIPHTWLVSKSVNSELFIYFHFVYLEFNPQVPLPYKFGLF